jgi:hypothetical protein
MMRKVVHRFVCSINHRIILDGKRGVMEEVYSRSTHHGEDFKRCDLMFTPVVNSIMMTCATEESGKKIRSVKSKSNTPKAEKTIPFTELESEMKRLKHKRFEVKHSDKKNNRTNAIPSKATYELKQLLEKSTEEGNENSPTEILLEMPIKSPRPSSGTIRKSNHLPRGESHSVKTPPTQSPRPRRPQTSQPSRYLSSTRKVQFPQEDDPHPDKGTEEAGGGGTDVRPTTESASRKKKPLKRDESRGIDDSMLQLSDDSSGDDNEVFDTFNMKGIYRLKKRRALMGASSDTQQSDSKPQQHHPFRRSQTFARQPTTHAAAPPPPQYVIPPSVALSEKEAYSAMIATQFLSNVLKKKPIASALPEDPNTLADPGIMGGIDPDAPPEEEVIKPELIRHLFPTNHGKNVSDDDNDELLRKHFNKLSVVQTSPGNGNGNDNGNRKHDLPHSPQTQTLKAKAKTAKAAKRPVHLLPPPASLRPFRRREVQKAVQRSGGEGEGDAGNEKDNQMTSSVEPPREDANLWLQKRMKALLAEYQAGEKKAGNLVIVDDETRRSFEARTISIEISLLFRGFQTIGLPPLPPISPISLPPISLSLCLPLSLSLLPSLPSLPLTPLPDG